jgi:hypothetical protein
MDVIWDPWDEMEMEMKMVTWEEGMNGRGRSFPYTLQGEQTREHEI